MQGFSVKFTKAEAVVVVDKAGKVVCNCHREGGLYVIELHFKNPIASSKDFPLVGK